MLFRSVKGLISDSGSPSMLVKTLGNYTDFDTIATKIGCKGGKQLECMQKVDASTLQKVYSETTGVSFTPVGDNVTAFSNTTDRLARGLVTRVVSFTRCLLSMQENSTDIMIALDLW